VLGVEFGADRSTEEGGDNMVDDLMKVIIDARQRARQNKDFETSDRIRDLLNDLNIEIKDSKEGATWEKK
jgi:cysteinyl-tRNA synthetase